MLDYDDLLLYWLEAARMPVIAAQMRSQFAHIHLLALTPDGTGLTVVGDGATAGCRSPWQQFRVGADRDLRVPRCYRAQYSGFPGFTQRKNVTVNLNVPPRQ